MEGKHELELKKLKFEREKLIFEKDEDEANLLEKELDKVEERSFWDNSSRSSRLSHENLNLLKILNHQNQISSKLVSNQQRSNLPKTDLQTFDGTDITKFPSFMLMFERTIENKLLYLAQYTHGRAKKIVQSCMHSDSGISYKKAKELLRKEYGNVHKISNTYLEKLSNWPQIKKDDETAIDELSLYLTNCSQFLDSMGGSEMNSPKEIMHIVMKLPYKLRENWRKLTHEILKSDRTVNFHDLVSFVADEAAPLRQPLFSKISEPLKPTRKTIGNGKSLNFIMKTDNEQSNNKICLCCKKNHLITSCNFSAKTRDEKSEFVKKMVFALAAFRETTCIKTAGTNWYVICAKNFILP